VNVENQAEVIAFLSSPSTHGGATVERIETHSAVVFLAGERAWKLKRAVRYDYLDFTGVERRRELCAAEVRINRRAAPALYRGVVAVTRERDGSLALGGSGEPVDWVIEMSRFDQAQLFDRLAARGALDLALMRPLATAIAELHAVAERHADHGGKAGMSWVIEGNAQDFAARGGGVLDAAACAQVSTESRRWIDRCGELLDARRAGGFVRQCHGDLHLRNIVLLDGRPTLFDAVEFNDEIARTDVWYDTAFLLMDLWKRGLRRHANVVWNGYLAEAEDFEGLPVIPLFLSCRAAVRAKTSLAASRLQSRLERRAALEEAAREYLTMALSLLRPPPPALIAIGGFSGSGKSALARELGPRIGAVPGAVVLRSDQARKRLHGVAELHRLGPEGYTLKSSQRVYGLLRERAAQVVTAGAAAIADAVFARPQDRAAIERVAQRAASPFVGLWLEAPEEVLLGRVRQRERDASDADPAVVRAQLAHSAPPPSSWHRIDAAADLETVTTRALETLRQCGVALEDTGFCSRAPSKLR
jgi:aminoglycoside phosphotransferase family enzyme/predicted kinase